VLSNSILHSELSAPSISLNRRGCERAADAQISPIPAELTNRDKTHRTPRYRTEDHEGHKDGETNCTEGNEGNEVYLRCLVQLTFGSFKTFGCFVSFCKKSLPVIVSFVISVLVLWVRSPFQSSVFFIQKAHRFFHRRAGNDWNVRRIMELANDGQADVSAGISREQSDH
jgi:hypothetical protein